MSSTQPFLKPTTKCNGHVVVIVGYVGLGPLAIWWFAVLGQHLELALARHMLLATLHNHLREDQTRPQPRDGSEQNDPLTLTETRMAATNTPMCSTRDHPLQLTTAEQQLPD